MLVNEPKIKELLKSISSDISDIDSVDIAEINEAKVIEKLKEVKQVINETLKYNKPATLLEEQSWSNSADNEYGFDPFVFDGTMSIHDYKKAADRAAAVVELEHELEDYDIEIDSLDRLSEPGRSLRLARVMTEMENKYGISVRLSNKHIDSRIMTIYNRASSLRNFDD